MINVRLQENTFRFITYYIYNYPEDSVKPAFCVNCSTELAKIKGHIVTIINENTPLSVTTSKFNQAYLLLKCRKCKTYFVIIIYTPSN